MIRLIKVLSIAGCLSLLATPASAIPFGIETTGGAGGWTVANNSSVVAIGTWAGSGGGSFEVAPGLVSWGIGGIFCPCSWSVTVGGNTIAAGSSSGSGWFGSFHSTGRTTAVQVSEPASLALLSLGLFGVWLAARRRKQLS